MKPFLNFFAILSVCAVWLPGCAAQAETPANVAAPALSVAATAPITAPLTILAPQSGASIARHTDIKGTAKPGGAGVKVKVEINPAGGEWFEQGTVNIAPDGTWSVPGFFGSDDTPAGSVFNVRAQLLDAKGKVMAQQTSDNLKKVGDAAVAAAAPMAPVKEAKKPLVMGYFPSYQTVLNPDEVRADRFTHVIYSFLTVDANGALDAASWANAPAITAAMHRKGVKVLLALSGGSNGDNFAKMARDPQKNAKFLTDAIAAMKKCGADGLVLDWEQPAAEDKALTTALVSALHRKIKAANPDAILVLVVNFGAWSSQGYDGPKLAKEVDYLHVMTYDFHGPWNHAGHHTSLFASKDDVEDGANLTYPAALQYWHGVQGFPLDKILFGIAGYGRGFRAPAWGAKVTGDAKYPEITYRDLSALIGHGWTRHWDADAHAPWLLSDDGSERISYDDPQSVADKARWMKDRGMPGFFIWEMSQEYLNGDNALTAAAQKAWLDAK